MTDKKKIAELDNAIKDIRAELADGTDIETDIITQVWQQELHQLLIKALKEIPADGVAVISRHYFSGVSALYEQQGKGRAKNKRGEGHCGTAKPFR